MHHSVKQIVSYKYLIFTVFCITSADFQVYFLIIAIKQLQFLRCYGLFLLLIYASLLCICITYIFLDSFGSFTSIPILHRKITIIFKVQNYTIIFGCTDSFVISENKTLVFTFCLSSKYNAIAKLQFTFTGQAFCSSNHAYLHFDPLPFICADFRIPV